MRSKLGYGIGLRPQHFPSFLASPPSSIDWLEIVSENYMGTGGRARHVLEQLRARYPIATHGVGLSIAGPDPLDHLYLKQLRELVSWLEPQLVTDHLCWTSWQGHHSYDLLPFPLNDASLDHIVARIHHVQEYLGRTLLFENPSCYIDFHSSTYSEPEFLAALCQRTSCGLLLDLNNCVVNSRNLGWDPQAYLDLLRPETVQQFHLAGHSVEADISIDTHDHAVPEAVWQLYEQAVQRFPDAGVLLEWDDKIPSLEAMEEELSIARRRAPTGRSTAVRVPARAAARRGDDATDLHKEQQLFFHSILHPEDGESFLPSLRSTPAGAGRGLKVYQFAYPARLSDVLKNTFPSLAYILEDELFGAVAAHYFQSQKPQHFSINYVGAALPRFLREVPSPFAFGVPQEAIAALAAFDWAHYELLISPPPSGPLLSPETLMQWGAEAWEEQRFQLTGEAKVLCLDWPMFDVWTAIQEERIPDPPEPQPEVCLFKRTREGHIRVEVLASPALYLLLSQGSDLAGCVALCAADNEEAAVQEVLSLLLMLAREGLLQKKIQPDEDRLSRAESI